MNNTLQLSISQLFASELVVEPTRVCVNGDIATLYSGGDLAEGATLWEYSRSYGRANLVQLPAFTAEQWITERGYGSVRLVSLLDLEAKLSARNLVSPKVADTRQWLDTITTAFALDPSPRYVWPTEPHAFESVLQEAMGLLTQPA